MGAHSTAASSGSSAESAGWSTRSWPPFDNSIERLTSSSTAPTLGARRLDSLIWRSYLAPRQPRKERNLSATAPDAELKARHRSMWASGDYPSMVETFLLPLGPRLVDACGIGPDMTVLDVAAGTGNASIPAAQKGARVTASDLTPELFDSGRARAAAEGVELEWVEADAERLPFEDGSFDVVMSSIGAMFGALFRAMGPFAPPPPPGAQPPPLWGGEDHIRDLFGDRVDLHTLQRDMLDIPQFQHPHDYGEHFKERYGPTIVARKNAASNGREEEFDQVL